MLETSNDILNITIAICIASISFFICWGLYYFNMSLKQVFKMIDELRYRMNKIDELVRLIQTKIESSTSYLFLIGEGVKRMTDIIKKYTEKKEKKKK